MCQDVSAQPTDTISYLEDMSEALQLTSCRVDLRRRRVLRPGITTRLTRNEAELLAYLVGCPENTASRDELLREVWGYAPSVNSRAVDQTVKRLRPKIEPDPSSPVHLITEHGVGYRLALLEFESRPSEELVGRSTELAQLAELLGQARLVTLLGPGGIGKTSLAAYLAERTHGVCFCDLSAVRDAPGLLQAIAAVLGLELPGSLEAAIETIGTALDGLVVLDNFEQLSSCTPLVSRWLEQAETARFLVTSRVRLRLPQEHCLELSPLQPHDAATLFARKGSPLRPDLQVDATVYDLVKRLDGIPLAIKLAAARSRLLSPQQLLERASLDLLVSSDEGRHGTLRRTIAWSWDLLSEDERRALSQLTVFRGSFALEAAEAVLGDSGLELLESLFDSSLVQVDGERAWLYESIHQFAAEHLEDAAPAHQRHADWLLQHIESRRNPRGHRAWETSHAVFTERENLRSVYEHTQGNRRAQAALQLADLYARRGPLELRREVLDHALDQDELDRGLQARLYAARAAAAWPRAAALDDQQKAWDIARSAGDRPQLLRMGGKYAQLLAAHERFADAEACIAEALTLIDDESSRASLIYSRGRVRADDFDLALADWDTARRIFEEQDNEVSAASCLHASVMLALEHDRLDGAEERLDRAIAKLERADEDQAELLVGIHGMIALAQGRLDEIEPWLKRSHRWSLETGDWSFQGEDLIELGYLDHLMGRSDRARSHYQQALAMLRAVAMDSHSHMLEALLAALAWEQGDEQASRSYLHCMSDRTERIGTPAAQRLLLTTQHYVAGEPIPSAITQRDRISLGVRKFLQLQRPRRPSS